MKEIKSFGPVDINPVKSSILFKARASFASVKIRKTHVDLEFQLAREVEILPVKVLGRGSRNRVVYATTADSLDQVDDFIVGLLRESYELISGI